ncbi:segregation and condensation protein A [Ruminococcus albus]|uniref:Segregation and condensation protein A n=1 Tax=Ruminococcus albus TaxID=1264 RepID=A0A1I1MKQ7_RUMAL|nr:segregation/condensation protein A [Ruminococcus albus]SFC83788.1 condensin subunit ScpA [Ruminococcus albus]
MSTARFKLDMFEGPLDLLLHLISKHKLNIYDIEIAVLLEQYLEYMAGLEKEDYEDAADFLEMAARLIYIKTASLLPKDEEGEELKKELQGSLIEYSLCKMAAARLKEQYAGGDIFVREPVKLPVKKTFSGEKDPQELLAAYLGMSEKARHSKPLKAEMFKPILSRKIVSVTSKIIHVLKMLITRGECFLDSMYDGCADKSERVAVFLAVLELTRSGRIFLNDDNTRVYMNSASKKRKISSDFDEAEIAAENGDENAFADEDEKSFGDETSKDSEETISREDTPAIEEREVSEEENSDRARFSEISPYGQDLRVQESTPLPYNKMYEPPERTVYKSETRQRGTLPVLKIELSPELQRIVDSGRRDMPADMAEEEIKAEISAENIVPEIRAEIAAESVETEIKTENAEPEIKADMAVEGGETEVKAEVDPVADESGIKAENTFENSAEITDLNAETEVKNETPAESTEPVIKTEDSADNIEAEVRAEIPTDTAKTEFGLEMPVETANSDIKAETAVDTAVNEIQTEAPAETIPAPSPIAEINTEVPETAAYIPNSEDIADDVPTVFKINRFGTRYYWGAHSWAEGRLRLG